MTRNGSFLAQGTRSSIRLSASANDVRDRRAHSYRISILVFLALIPVLEAAGQSACQQLGANCNWQPSNQGGFSSSPSTSQCGVPLFVGAQTNANIAAYMTGPYRSWCLAHGGTTDRSGNCVRGPNFRCDLGANANGPQPTTVVGAMVQAMPSILLSGGGQKAMQQQLLGVASQQMIGSFLSWLTNPNPAAAAQKQQMMAELQRRQQEAAAQHRAEEALRLQQTYDRLSGEMKLTGQSDLQLKTSGGDDGELHLKLTGNINDPNHAGIPGLPGIYLNDPAPAPVMQASGMQLKLGESTDTPSNLPASGLPADVPIADGSPQFKLGDNSSGSVTGPAPPAQPFDPAKMTPQQAADMAEATSRLTPEQQQQLMASTTSQPGPASPQSLGASSQAAAAAATPEQAAAQAQVGFDQAGGVAVLSPSAPPAVQLSAPTSAPASTDPMLTGKVTLPVHPGSASEVNVAPGEPIVPSPAPHLAVERPPASQRIRQMSNAQLLAATCHTHDMLVEMKSGFKDDAEHLEKWYEESADAQTEALNAAGECVVDLSKDAVGEWLLAKLGIENKPSVGDKASDEWEDFQEDVRKANRDFATSKRTRDDLLDNARAVLQAFYEYTRKQLKDQSKLKQFSKYGAEIADFVQCATEYSNAVFEWKVNKDQITQTNGNLDTKLKAEQVLSGFYQEQVGEVLRRGLNPNACQ
jgi:hypothetical protein